MGRTGAGIVGSEDAEQSSLSVDCKCCNGDSCEPAAAWPDGNSSHEDSLPSATAILHLPQSPGMASDHLLGKNGCRVVVPCSITECADAASAGKDAALMQPAAVHLHAIRAKRPRPAGTLPKAPSAQPSLPSLSARDGTDADGTLSARAQPQTPPFLPRDEPAKQPSPAQLSDVPRSPTDQAAQATKEAQQLSGAVLESSPVEQQKQQLSPAGQPMQQQSSASPAVQHQSVVGQLAHLQVPAGQQAHQQQHAQLLHHTQTSQQASPGGQQASPSVQKQRAACVTAMLSPPPRTATPPVYCPSAAALLLGLRLSIRTAQGSRNGKVIDMQPGVNKHRLLFDDGSCEWVVLSNSSWRWLAPRTPSAGLTPSLRTALRKLGASNVVHDPNKPMPVPSQGPPIPVLGPTPCDAAAAVGHKVWLWSPGDMRWHAGLVLALSSAGSNRHHVVYLDGTDEWVELNKEVVAWEPMPSTGKAGTKVPHRPVLGLSGAAAPAGQAAVGWRVAIYWSQDQTFYEGTVTAYKPSRGQHEIVYDDDEREHMRLHEEIVVWRCKAATASSSRREQAQQRKAARSHADGPSGSSRGPAGKRARCTVDSGLLRSRTSSASPSDVSGAPVDPEQPAGASPMQGVEKPQACKPSAGTQLRGVNMMQQVV